ncbi:MAG: sugar phosphate isomerase/epimerase [Anaerolineae bacterium]|jgi:sugar phosphate isomerase/epimerase|nr:sugar phosphate isomerase/epimerase [Anaerolineae bacterium]
MRFGIMAMQIGALIPEGLSPDEMHDYVGSFNHAELVRALNRQGFALVELGGDLSAFMPQTFAPSQIAELLALKAKLGLQYTVHLPLWSVEPSTPQRYVREGSVRAVVDIIKATLPLEPEVYVLHATGALASEFTAMALPPVGRGLILRQFQQAAMQSLQMILSMTGISSRQLAIETVEFPFDLTLEMAEALDLSMCLDVGHVLSGFCGETDLFRILTLSAGRLVEIHLHDADRPKIPGTVVYGRDHRPLGAGDLDLGPFLDAVVATGFDGPVIFELRADEARASLDVVRRTRPGIVSA